MAGLTDLNALSDLLRAGDDAANDGPGDSSQQTATPASLAGIDPTITRPVPAVLGSEQHKKEQEAASKGSAAPADSGDIWGADEVVDEAAIEVQSKDDNRKVPKHEMYYKQAVDSGDVWLGLSDKDPGSGSCTHLVVKVHFPNHAMKEIDLDVTVSLRSPRWS
jgi:hypothetical protein